MPITNKPLVSLSGNRLITTSLAVSQHFERKHKDVLRSIEQLDCSEEFAQRNFAPCSYSDGNQRKRPMYEITRDGFMFLCMGFTGAQAAKWKESYIKVFNHMEQQLQGNVRARLGLRPKVNRTIERQVMEMYIAGHSQADIARSLRISTSAVSQLLHARWNFSTVAGEPECTPALLDAVAARHLALEQQKIIQQLQRVA